MNLDWDECSTSLCYSLPFILNQHEIIHNEEDKMKLESNSTNNSSSVISVTKSNENKYQLLENVNYGALHENLPEHGNQKYYLTTAIAYTNGYPHIGHAYEVFSFRFSVTFFSFSQLML